MIVKRSDIYLVDLTDATGSCQGGIRPCLVISNNVCNKFSPTITIIPISAQVHKAKLPTHVVVKAGNHGLVRDSVILCEQTRPVDKNRIIGERLAQLDHETMNRVTHATQIQIGAVDVYTNNNVSNRELCLA